MPCIASDFKRELRPPFRFPLPSETLVTGDAVPGGWVKEFRQVHALPKMI